MKLLKEKKFVERFDNMIKVLEEEVVGHAERLIDAAPPMTPIEALAFMDLVALSEFDKYVTITPQAQIGEYRVDFLVSFFSEKFIIECDGHDFHEKTKEQAGRDKKRDRRLQASGFKVFRFAGSEIWKNSTWVDEVAKEIAEILDREAARHATNKRN